MRIGLVDVDGHNFPNLVLMKLSAWHKKNGDSVEWYLPLKGHFDKVYLSKVFSFTEDFEYCIDADEVIRGGSGYCISLVDGKEVFDKSKDINLPDEIEHIYPDYSLYGIEDTAYGFLSRGCPRGCDFCIVGKKEGRCSIKVADLNEFWSGQKHIVLLDPNLLACRECEDLLKQLAESEAVVDFCQGLDIRLMTDRKAELLKDIKVKTVHFAWDRFQDKDIIVPRLKLFAETTGWKRDTVGVYILVNFDTTIEQDLERVYTVRDIGFSPYLMIYDKEHLPKRHTLRRMQRWVNNRVIFNRCKTFEEYNG